MFVKQRTIHSPLQSKMKAPTSQQKRKHQLSYLAHQVLLNVYMYHTIVPHRDCAILRVLMSLLHYCIRSYTVVALSLETNAASCGS